MGETPAEVLMLDYNSCCVPLCAPANKVRSISQTASALSELLFPSFDRGGEARVGLAWKYYR